MATWSDIEDKIVTDLSNVNLAVDQWAKGDQSMRYKTADELKALADFIDGQASKASGKLRTYAYRVRD